MADLAVAVACGARDIVDIEAMRAQRDQLEARYSASQIVLDVQILGAG